VADDKRSAWLKKVDEEWPYQVALPRRQLMDESAIMDFLLAYVGKFDLYVEDQCPAYVRYCFQEPMDAAIFRSRFERKSEAFRLAG
jgi:L-lysine 2,3-aminomutase